MICNILFHRISTDGCFVSFVANIIIQDTIKSPNFFGQYCVDKDFQNIFFKILKPY